MAIKELQSNCLSHEGWKHPLALHGQQSKGQGRMTLCSQLKVKPKIQKKTNLLFPNCLTRDSQELKENKFIRIASLSSRSVAAECYVRLSAVIVASRGAGESICPYLELLSIQPLSAATNLWTPPLDPAHLALKGTELYNPPPPVAGRVHGQHQSPVVHMSSPTVQVGATAYFT